MGRYKVTVFLFATEEDGTEKDQVSLLVDTIIIA